MPQPVTVIVSGRVRTAAKKARSRSAQHLMRAAQHAIADGCVHAAVQLLEGAVSVCKTPIVNDKKRIRKARRSSWRMLVSMYLDGKVDDDGSPLYEAVKRSAEKKGE